MPLCPGLLSESTQSSHEARSGFPGVRCCAPLRHMGQHRCLAPGWWEAPSQGEAETFTPFNLPNRAPQSLGTYPLCLHGVRSEQYLPTRCKQTSPKWLWEPSVPMCSDRQQRRLRNPDLDGSPGAEAGGPQLSSWTH